MDYRKEMNNLLEPTSIMVFDAVDNISYQIEQFVKEPAKGLYYGSGLYPILVDGKKYVPASGLDTDVVTPINGITWTIDDVKKWRNIGLKSAKTGKTVFLNKQKYAINAFSSRPVANVNAVSFIFLWVQNFLASISPYAKRGNLQSKMMDCLKDNEACEKLLSGELDRLLEPLSSEIADWVGKDIWHIYFVKNRHTSITIEKTSDYRIWCYYEMLEKAEEKEKEE